jgi:hypothetical protein
LTDPFHWGGLAPAGNRLRHWGVGLKLRFKISRTA